MVWREHGKLWKNRMLYVVLFLGVVANVFLLWRSEYGRNPYIDVSVKQYLACYDKIADMEPEEAKAFLQKMTETEDEISYQERAAYQLLAAEISDTGTYDAYLERKEAEAAERQDFAIFRMEKNSSYSDADTEKALQVFRKFQGRELKIGPSRGIYMVLDFMQTDLLALLVILFALAMAFMREKELGEHDFIRTFANGREHLMAAKFLSLCLFSVETAVVLYAGSLLTAVSVYGFGDLSRYLQSVGNYIASGFDGSVGEAFAFAFLCKALNYMLVMAVILLFMVLCRRAVGVYLCTGIWLGVSALLFYGIGENSYLSILKNINIIAYLQTGRLLNNYRNINLFGKPVTYTSVYLFTVLTGILLAMLLLVWRFSVQKIPSRANVTDAFRKKICSVRKNGQGEISSVHKKRQHVCGYVRGIGIEESKKIFFHQKVLFLLIVAAGVVWYSYEPVASIYGDEDDIYYKRYVDELSGVYSADKEAKLLNWETEMAELQDAREEELEKAVTDMMASLISEKYEKQLKPETALMKLREHTEYIKMIPNGGYFYPRGYEKLTAGENAGDADALHALAAVFLVILCLTGIYAMEYEAGMLRLLRCTPNGRKSLDLRKCGIGLLLLLLIYALVYGPWFYQIFSAYGTDGISLSVAGMEHIPKQFQNFSVLSYLIFISLLRFLGLLLIMAGIFWLVRRTKSYIMTMAIAVGIFVLPLLLELSGLTVMRYVLLNPLLLGNISF